MDNKKEYILCAAVLRKESKRTVNGTPPYKAENNDILKIEIGYRHHDIWQLYFSELQLPNDGVDTNGFYTSKGKFVSRKEAMKIAYEAGQVSERKAFYSEKDIELYKKLNLYKNEKVGDFKPLASEDLYCCSPDGDTLNE